MYKNLYIFFKYLKFYYNHYNLVVVRSERIYQNSFFVNNIITSRSFNLNFYLDTHWSFLNRKTSYSLGFSSSFFSFKTNDFFFNFLSKFFDFKSSCGAVSSFSISSSDRKNSRKLWKYRFVSVILNFSDWSIFFKNSIKKSKILFLFGASHPLQNLNFQDLKQSELESYNNSEVSFNVDISEGTVLNLNKRLLFSEFFFYNNSYGCDMVIDSNVFSFFLFKAFSVSSVFYKNKILFKQPLILSFFFLINYPYFFKNNYFALESVKDFNVSSNFFFDKSGPSGLCNLSSFNLILLKSVNCLFFKNNNGSVIGYYNFFIAINLLFSYGITKKKTKRYFKKFMKKKPNKKIVKPKSVYFK